MITTPLACQYLSVCKANWRIGVAALGRSDIADFTKTIHADGAIRTTPVYLEIHIAFQAKLIIDVRSLRIG